MPPGHDADKLRLAILEHFDMSLGMGLTKLKGKVFRIGHLGDFNDLMLAGTLCGVEMGLDLAGVPHKTGGVAAALDLGVAARPVDALRAVTLGLLDHLLARQHPAAGPNQCAQHAELERRERQLVQALEEGAVEPHTELGLVHTLARRGEEDRLDLVPEVAVGIGGDADAALSDEQKQTLIDGVLQTFDGIRSEDHDDD